MVEAIDVLGLLKEEMSTDEIHLKVNAIHRMRTVIASINNSQVIDNLIPYLNSKCYLQENFKFFNKLLIPVLILLALITGNSREDDEVLFAIAEEIGKVFHLIGDKTIFLPLLEQLAESDETVVREEAVKSLTSISK